MNTKKLIKRKKIEKIKKIQKKIKKLNITYDEYIKRKNDSKKIIEINNNIKNIEKKIKELKHYKRKFK